MEKESFNIVLVCAFDDIRSSAIFTQQAKTHHQPSWLSSARAWKKSVIYADFDWPFVQRHAPSWWLL